jgi:peptidoglycan/xylan/chitin deacetylase (PgdA/CDA1 family)/CelD/BcsL family acetyltransferase involved in cellulose biosynthesis
VKLVEIREESDFHGLKSAWETLLRDSASRTIFLTHEWATAWWSSYGVPQELRIMAAFDDSGALRGIAPLRSQRLSRYGQTVPALTFLGDGSNDSDYLDLIISSGYEEPVMQAFGYRWLEELRHGTVLVLNEIPETSPNLRHLKKLAEPQKAVWTEEDVGCGTVHMPQTWQEYLATLRPRFRTKLRSLLRNLEGRPEVQFGFCETAEQVRQMLPVLFDLHSRRWAQDGKPGVFGWDCKREFYLELSLLLLERGWLRFSWLEWKGRVLACQYGFIHGDTYFHLQEGYEPACEHWNVGAGLRAWSIRELLNQGVREYDFLGGVTRHKTDWGAEVKQSKRIQVASASYKNILFCRGPEWEFRARESVSRILPEKIMAARRARLENQARTAAGGSASGHTAEQAANGWMQRAAARCYFHFGLSALARPFRDQYQLSLRANRKWPTGSWSKRAEATGRILYYHRVNDDNDPFFPAISTWLFEQEMRFIARSYKVVSLSKLLEHLEGQSAENVVAITFDDGYQDNYENAFPVLRRYGLAATIFLTTGSIDTREPLWFEQLALALKKTQVEFIDLEIDIPRRFWARTQTERLESNGRIFELLRALPDPERREWLARILQQLSFRDEGERRNKMLVWDQVRLMKAQELEFGGHTVTHPFISRMSPEQVTWEVSECKRRIEEELQQPVHYFAYPNGREQDFGKWNKELISAAGYRAAVTTQWGLNNWLTDRMELRRGGPWEESPAMFAYKMDWYQLVND